MKNKEIEELLNELKEYASGGMSGLYPSEETVKNFVSYIEQLENLCNKYEQEHKTTFEVWKEDIKKLKQLENNRDKAIEYVESHFIFNDKTGECYQTHTFDKDNVKKLYDILKGDSE